jgi:malic enzyme
MNILKTEALAYHDGPRPGKIEVTPPKPCRTQRDLSLAYTPGVAEPCLARNHRHEIALGRIFERITRFLLTTAPPFWDSGTLERLRESR